MSKTYDVEKGLISKLLETKDMNALQEKQISTMYFTGDNKRAFKFIQSYYSDKGEMPTVRVFKRKMPNYKLETYIHDEALKPTIGTDESVNHWCDEIRTKFKHNTLADTSDQVANFLAEGDPHQAFSLMKKTMLFIEGQIEESTSVTITEGLEDRKKAYLKRKENQGLIGIPSGMNQLDFILKGWQPSQLITLIASTGVGKTWFEVLLGAYAMLNGLTVVHFITEMSEDAMRDRYEAVLYGKVTGEMNYNRFKSGKLTPVEEESYFDFLDSRLSKMEPLHIEVATGVSSVNAKIDEYEPDLVLIDGAYLMEDEQGAKDDWLRVAHITRDLKKLAKAKKLPIFINSQADSTTSKKTGPGLHNIGYAKSIGQDSDVVLMMFQDEQMREDKEMKIGVLKQREGRLGSIFSNWDFTKMNFDPIYSDVPRDEPADLIDAVSVEVDVPEGRKKPKVKLGKQKGMVQL